LIRIDPTERYSATNFVCDLCSAMPKPTDGGKTYTFNIRKGIKFHNGDPLTAADVAASWQEIIFPPKGVLSPRAPNYLMVKDVEASGPYTVAFHLKFATNAFLPALASPFDYTSVPLRLSWRKVDVSAGKTQLEFVLKSPPGGISVRPEDSMMNIDCLAFVRPSGKVDGESFPVELAMKLSPSQARNLATTGFVYRKQIPLTPGRYDLRVLVRDNITNKIGTVSTVVNFTP